MDLQDFLFKKVIIIDKNNKEYTGYIDFYSSAYDNDDTEDSIGIIPNEKSKSGIELFASEIKSIEVIQ